MGLYLYSPMGHSISTPTNAHIKIFYIESRWDEIFRPSRPALGPTQPPVKWVPGLSRGKVQLGRAADHSPPSSAAVMEEESYTSTHPLGHTGPVTGSLYLYLIYIYIYFPPNCHHMSFVDFVVLPPGHGRSVTDF